MDADYWNDRYGESTRIWSGNPNPQLVAEATTLTAGRALDAGCGEGADAVWLARHGWQVTAVDFAQVALDKGAAEAVDLDIVWRRQDLVEWQPAQEFDLVSAQFLHLDPPLRDRALGNLAAGVVRGGRLLVVGHHTKDLLTHTGHERHRNTLFEPGDITGLLDAGEWRIEVAEARPRQIVTAEGEPFTYTDTVVRARRI